MGGQSPSKLGSVAAGSKTTTTTPSSPLVVVPSPQNYAPVSPIIQHYQRIQAPEMEGFRPEGPFRPRKDSAIGLSTDAGSTAASPDHNHKLSGQIWQQNSYVCVILLSKDPLNAPNTHYLVASFYGERTTTAVRAHIV